MQLEELHRDQFTQYLQGEFQVIDEPNRQFAIQLFDIIEGAKSARQEVFALLFRGPHQPFIPQGIHKLSHQQLGEMDIFLVPVGQDPNGFQYEAVFNRILPV